MPWICYSCGAKNPNSAEACVKCGNTTAAPASFYVHWVFGGAIFFVLFYLGGIFLGGTLVAFVAAPTQASIDAEAKSLGASPNQALVDPGILAKAKVVAADKARAAMSPVLRGLLYWSLVVVLFVLCGAIVGFVSDGKTIIEAALGSLLGQFGGFLIVTYAFKSGPGWVPGMVALLPGFGLAMLGAWLGEKYQDRAERAR